MEEPQKIDVTFIDGRWTSEVGDFYFGSRGLALLIDTVQRSFPGEAFIFAIDKASVAGNIQAEQEVLEATEARQAIVEISADSD
jgi:hypothetical protein